MNSPQKTPTTEQPLSSVRFKGIFGIFARSETNDQIAAALGRGTQSHFRETAADRIAYDVHAFVIGDLSDASA